MVARIKDSSVTALVTCFVSVVKLKRRLEVPPRIIQSPATVLKRHAMEFRTFHRITQQREDVFFAEVVLFAPQTGKVGIEATFIRACHTHHLVTHLDNRVVILSIELRSVKCRTSCKCPACSLVRTTIVFVGHFDK